MSCLIPSGGQPKWLRLAGAVALSLTGLWAASAHAQTTASAPIASPRKTYLPASVHAAPGLTCSLFAKGSPAASVPVFTDDDGYARFYAVPAAAGAAVKTLVLNCHAADGQLASTTVDLTSPQTFRPNPLNLANERGTDRPALAGDPMSYSQAYLIQAGYGLRPDPAIDGKAYSRWLSVATRAGRMLAARRPSLHSHTVTSTFANPWSGTVITGAPSYISTYANFNVPSGVPGGDGTSTTKIAIWNGLGGFGTGAGLIQGGVDVYTAPSYAAYASWREYCCGDPDSNGYAGAFAPNPGDEIYSEEWYCDSSGNANINGGYGCSYIYDYNTKALLNCTSASSTSCWSVKANALCSASPSTPNCMKLGEAAEFIIENQSPQVSKTSTAFTDFTPEVTMSGAAYSSRTNSYSQTVSTDPDVYLLMDFTNTSTHILVAPGSTDETYFNIEPGVSSYPLFCQGPLSTSNAPVPLTNFKWSSVGAGTASPGPGECAWADRGPSGSEIKSGDVNTIYGTINGLANLPEGKFGELGVYRDSNLSNDMVVTQIVGVVSPPFSSNVALPPK